MTSIAALNQQISRYEQRIDAKQKEMAKYQRHGVMETVLDEQQKAVGDAQVAHRDQQDIQQYQQEIQKLTQQRTEIEHQLTNLDAKIQERHNQHIADQQRLEQSYKVDIHQLESEKLRLIG